MIAAPAAVPFWSPDEVEASLRDTIAHLHAVHHASVETLVRLKRRPPAKPFLLLVAGSDMLGRLGLHLTPAAARLAAVHWPGPLTLVLPGQCTAASRAAAGVRCSPSRPSMSLPATRNRKGLAGGRR